MRQQFDFSRAVAKVMCSCIKGHMEKRKLLSEYLVASAGPAELGFMFLFWRRTGLAKLLVSPAAPPK